VNEDGSIAAAFGASEMQALLALEVLSIVKGWKGLRVTTDRRHAADAWKVELTLQCFVASFLADDPRAHCCVVVRPSDIVPYQATESGRVATARISPVTGLAVYPCRRLLGQASGRRLDPSHPSPLRAQLQAAAIDAGCSFCPNFSPDGLRALGEGEMAANQERNRLT
jgi:hypothetical protein